MSSFQFTAYLTVPQPLLAQLQSAVSSFQFTLFLRALPDFKRVSPRVIRSPENGRITKKALEENVSNLDDLP